MEFITKGEFIQAIKDYDYICELWNRERENYQRLKYLRYEKVRSPLDYDVVGYQDKETVRVIKGRGSYNPSEILDNQEKLEKKMGESLNKIGEYSNKLGKIDRSLNEVKEPLRSMLIMKYKQRKTLKEVAEKYPMISFTESGIYKYIDKTLDEYFKTET